MFVFLLILILFFFLPRNYLKLIINKIFQFRSLLNSIDFNKNKSTYFVRFFSFFKILGSRSSSSLLSSKPISRMPDMHTTKGGPNVMDHWIPDSMVMDQQHLFSPFYSTKNGDFKYTREKKNTHIHLFSNRFVPFFFLRFFRNTEPIDYLSKTCLPLLGPTPLSRQLIRYKVSTRIKIYKEILFYQNLLKKTISLPFIHDNFHSKYASSTPSFIKSIRLGRYLNRAWAHSSF